MAYSTVVLRLFLSGLALLIVVAIYKAIYNLYFHPLAKFPGPKLAALSHIWYSQNIIAHNSAYATHEAHLKYGDVVRIAPDELSFATAQSWKDIYGHATKGHQPFLKGTWYDQPGVQSGIVIERDPVKHREVRKNLSHAFSAKTLQGQEAIVQQYINMFIGQIKRLGCHEEGINVTEWFNWLTFDIIGDLAFGESFGAIENARTHFWTDLLLNSSFASSMVNVFIRFPTIKFLLPTRLLFRKSFEDRKIHLNFVMEKVAQRMSKANDRPDFFSHLLSDKATNISAPFLKSQAHILIVAGSETTATTLAAMAYYTTKHPEKLAMLTKEIRDEFTDEAQIDANSTQKLRYLFAVIEESMRIFPPVPLGLQRISPGAEIDGYYVPRGFNVSTHMYASKHSSTNFHRPDEFHPERWLPHDHEHYSPVFAYDKLEASKPFSLGPRACLGINLAYMELRITIAKLAWNFDWELVDPKMPWRPKNSVLWEKPKTMIRFKPVVRT